MVDNNDLQLKAETIVQELDLQTVLNVYGEAHLVGNVALGTTVKPDIDYLIYLPKESWSNTISGLKETFSKKGITDYEERELKESSKYLITFKTSADGLFWSIDITLSDKTGDYLSDSYRFWLDYHDKFTPAAIKVILHLKKHFHEKRMLRNSMSYYIYRAVIDENAKNVSDIYNYLKKHKVYLGRFKL